MSDYPAAYGSGSTAGTTSSTVQQPGAPFSGTSMKGGASSASKTCKGRSFKKCGKNKTICQWTKGKTHYCRRKSRTLCRGRGKDDCETLKIHNPHMSPAVRQRCKYIEGPILNSCRRITTRRTKAKTSNRRKTGKKTQGILSSLGF
jgi:hypothetical protein